MKRTMAMVFGVAAILSAIFTATIMAADIVEDRNYKGTVNFDEGAILKIKNVQVTATAAQLNAAGAGTTQTLTPSNITMTGKMVFPVATGGTVTNGGTLTLSGVINIVSGIGGANNATNTITLANPSALGQLCILMCAKTSTNLLAIAASGNNQGPAIELSAGQSTILYGSTTTNWASVGNQ